MEMKEVMKQAFIKRMQNDNPWILSDEAWTIFEKNYPYYKYMRGAEFDCLHNDENKTSSLWF